VTVDTRLAEIERQYEEIQGQLSRPDVATDPDALRRHGRELARLDPIVTAYRELVEVRGGLARTRDLIEGEADPDMRELAREEVEALTARERALEEQLRLLLLPRDPNDERNVIVEIRAGTGGEEAALFAAELYRMYVNYATRRGWRAEAITLSETGIGGLKEAILEVQGDGAYSRLKYEAGVHRVQRVPETESGGRIHTSTATVAVLPEADEVDFRLDDKDLRIEVKRASGPGGQSVNTTDSAVRITHIPSGLSVEIQDEKSQHKNKARALAVLRARLLEIEQRKAHEAEAEVRRSMVGSGERSEKIRTYNFPQDRITDHRIGLDLHNLPQVLNGDLDRLIEGLQAKDQELLLAGLTDGDRAPA
jgi:peptide chain release factor 1